MLNIFGQCVSIYNVHEFRSAFDGFTPIRNESLNKKTVNENSEISSSDFAYCVSVYEKLKSTLLNQAILNWLSHTPHTQTNSPKTNDYSPK